MDRNNIIGFALIFLILLAYSVYSSMQPQAVQPKQTQVQVLPKAAPAAVVSAAPTDSVAARQQYGDFAAAGLGVEKDIVLENKDIRLTLSNRGGRVKEVRLKNYQTYDQKPLILVDEKHGSRTLTLPTRTGDVNLTNLYFTTADAGKTITKGDSARVTFRLALAENQFVEQTYTLKGSGFEVDYDLKISGLDNQLSNAPMQFYWKEDLQRFEKDVPTSRLYSTINYYGVDEAFDYLSETSTDPQDETIAAPLRWVALKQKFFLAAFIAKGAPLAASQFKSSVDASDPNDIKTLEANLKLPIADLKAGKGRYEFYFGPNDYRSIENVTDGFRKNVYLGWPVIREVSRFVILPIFHFFEMFIRNYGLLIIVLVLVVKTILFPLVYKSYISMAKTRVLQPEIEEIKARNDGDMQKVQQEQMKLYSQVGVNPLSGCVPVLLQMPILFALFSLFPNLIEFRQKGFLWSNDLSTYDALIQLPFTIPFTASSHISMFAVLMTLSSLAFTYYNSQTNVSAVPGPYKTIQYVMPVFIMFVLNSSPAGLNFYYFVSNLVTIGQQLAIRQFVDEGAIRRKLDENREKNKDKKTTGFQARLQEAMRKANENKQEADAKKLAPGSTTKRPKK